MNKARRFIQAIAVVFILFTSSLASAQPLNIIITDAEADAVLKGNYNPNDYLAGADIASLDEIACTINAEVFPDSLRHYLEIMQTFHNRNTYSDTLSATTGIGVARAWALQKFQQFSNSANGRLLPSYVQFDMPAGGVCGSGRLKNIIAVLPGTQINDPALVIIEAHLDSRCADECDIQCVAQGMEDNGSGSALVIELARVMSRFAFDHTIVFMLTVGEEQGLYGAQAMADYCQQNAIPVKAVQNNDIVGGIYCGATSSAPSCPFEGNVDSTHLRLFSYGWANSKYKAYARYVKMVYEEKLLPIVNVPMQVMVMTPEDRMGRGGDHIPFRQNGFAAIRFTSANEHGDANVADSNYHDRQHTSADILGVDTTGDSILDSFFVSFTYLARNTVINGVSAASAALAPTMPVDFTITDDGANVSVTIDDSMHYKHYRIGVRSTTNDFDAVYSVTDTNYLEVPHLSSGILYRVSVAAVNHESVMSLFSVEKNVTPSVNTSASADTVDYSMVNCTTFNDKVLHTLPSGITMYFYPNPTSGKVIAGIEVQEGFNTNNTFIEIHDVKGTLVKQSKVNLQKGMNRLELDYGMLANGNYECLLRAGNLLLQKSRLVIIR